MAGTQADLTAETMGLLTMTEVRVWNVDTFTLDGTTDLAYSFRVFGLYEI